MNLKARDDRGVSSVELVLYMPLMFFAIFATVQFGLMYLGNQAALAAARETARVVRTGGDAATAEARGRDYLAAVGRGLIENSTISVQGTGSAAEPEVLAVVEGDALKVVPGLPAPHIRQAVRGPVEEFRVDDGAP
jgi:Flp pilus assembly protein TadG